MQSLVDYGSSSDEENASPSSNSVPPSASRNTNAGQSTLNGAVPLQASRKKDSEISADARPVVGPMMRETATIESEDAGFEVPEGLSERDLIRQLTQASHPMTSIPSSPTGSPNRDIEAKFRHFLELKSKGLHFNEDLMSKSSFHNPALFENMMGKTGLDSDAQYATNMPSTVYDHNTLPTHAYKEELLRSQQSIREGQNARKKQASAAGKRSIEFTPANGSETRVQKAMPQ